METAAVRQGSEVTLRREPEAFDADGKAREHVLLAGMSLIEAPLQRPLAAIEPEGEFGRSGSGEEASG